ncbi:MAG: hypothetical protein IJF33_06910 [Clostridia bacterium]|nr:hypothetical protein [Clostridia bacterium]
MTKQEVLQGALALNGNDKKYTVTVEGDKIIIETKYRGTRVRESTFRCIAHIKDDKTYTESTYDFDGYCKQYGVRKKAVSYCLDGSKEVFDSEEIKKVLRDYLDSCRYQRIVNKKLIALCISIPVVVVVVILVAVIILLASESNFVDINGSENFALTEITRDDILSKNNNYRSSMVSERHSGRHTNIIGTRLRDCDYDSISRSFGKLHGIIILQATKISENTLTLNINSSVESGNAEIVILIDGGYYCSVDVNQNQSITLQDISNKEVIVKLAGEGAKMKIDISRTY